MGFKEKLENTPEVIETAVGKIKVKLPTLRERLEVKAELKKLPNYNLLDDEEKRLYEMYLVALKCIVEPKISLQEFLEAPDVQILAILAEVSKWYADKLASVNKDFLDLGRRST